MLRKAPPTAKKLIEALEVLERFAAHGLVERKPASGSDRPKTGKAPGRGRE